MAMEGNGVLGSSEAVREGQVMDLTLQSVAAFLMGDSPQNTFSGQQEYYPPRLNGDRREWSSGFEQGGQVMDPTLQSVAAFLIGDSPQNTFSGQQEYYPPRLVREAFGHCMKSGPAMVGGREQIQEPDRRNLQLRFQTGMPDLFFVGGEVKGLDGATICVKLIDATTGHVVESGPLSSLTLDVVVLAGDFENNDDDSWAWEDFKRNVETGREGKGLLLEGNLQVPLKAGVGYLAKFKFTDISSRRSGKFRLGVKVEQGFFQGIRVREAKTAAFRVIHSKKDAKEKHVPRALDDDACKLICIGEKGRKNLNGVGIFKVEDFLWKLCLDPEGLRKILGKTMSGSNWKTLGDHAKKSVPSGKYHVYYADDTKNSGVVFKNMSELCGLIEDGKYYWAETVSDRQKVHTLKKKACANWKDIVEYDGLLPLEMNPRERACSSQTDIVAPESRPPDIDRRVSPAFLTLVAPQPGLMNPGLAVGGNVIMGVVRVVGNTCSLQGNDIRGVVMVVGNTCSLHRNVIRGVVTVVGNTCSLHGNDIQGVVKVVGNTCSLQMNVIKGAVTVVGGDGCEARRRVMASLYSKFKGLSDYGPVD